MFLLIDFNWGGISACGAWHMSAAKFGSEKDNPAAAVGKNVSASASPAGACAQIKAISAGDKPSKGRGIFSYMQPGLRDHTIRGKNQPAIRNVKTLDDKTRKVF